MKIKFPIPALTLSLLLCLSPLVHAHAAEGNAQDDAQQAAEAFYTARDHETGANGTPQNIEEAIKWYTISASLGNAEAQYNLGKIYYDGQHGEPDIGMALKYFQQSAEQGVARAQHILGVIYSKPYPGIERDYSEALKWFKKAADQGDAQSQFNLGIMYDKGQGVPRSLGDAFKWFLKSAENGYGQGQFNVALMYAEGDGTGIDLSEAYRWMKEAERQHVYDAGRNAQVIWDMMSPEERASSNVTPTPPANP